MKLIMFDCSRMFATLENIIFYRYNSVKDFNMIVILFISIAIFITLRKRLISSKDTIEVSSKTDTTHASTDNKNGVSHEGKPDISCWKRVASAISILKHFLTMMVLSWISLNTCNATLMALIDLCENTFGETVLNAILITGFINITSLFLTCFIIVYLSFCNWI
ncbi:similar to Saccharomyces cerevisiae YBR259W Putative protein of unknown function [Maudiozyma saulgeensis]|uniref:Uncharacterized protein n=1 Tax=Maudiozyma saulgeensis TaxID=1789683 RepID=A0A1X7RBT9_9SACH|nr:similar to Saccharomyces cerevisiae YBR259W Putative protein of unknown function [Kazachstania saulgeensis]